jgi:glutathione peroxidase
MNTLRSLTDRLAQSAPQTVLGGVLALLALGVILMAPAPAAWAADSAGAAAKPRVDPPPQLPTGAAPPAAALPEPAPPEAEAWKTRSLWSLETSTLEGEPIALATFEGKVALIVNVASKCGLTPQYTALEKLATEYREKGLVVLAFPCNDFGNQEPGTAEEIRTFCTSRHGITFPIFAKVSVKPGETQAPLFKALEVKSGATPRWNFGKYLVSRDGTRAQFFDSKVTPDAKELRAAIDRLLAEPSPPPATAPCPASPPEQPAPPAR